MSNMESNFHPFSRFIYSKAECQREREKDADRETERNLPSTGLFLKRPQSQGWARLKPGIRNSIWLVEPKYLGYHLVFPRHFSRKLDWKHSWDSNNMGY